MARRWGGRLRDSLLVARLDATRVAAWRELQSVAAELERAIDDRPPRRVGPAARLVRRARRAAAPRRHGPSERAGMPSCASCVRASAAASTGSRRRAGWHGATAVTSTTTARDRRADPPRPGAVAGDERHVPAGRAARTVAPVGSTTTTCTGRSPRRAVDLTVGPVAGVTAGSHAAPPGASPAA